LYLQDIYDILVVEKKGADNSIEKGKPSEKMGHKTLEPKSPEGLMAVSCQKENKT
jgi:hypothetical protein